MYELIFTVEETPEGRYRAYAFDGHIMVEAATWEELQEKIAEAVNERFPGDEGPDSIRLDIR